MQSFDDEILRTAFQRKVVSRLAGYYCLEDKATLQREVDA